MITDTNLIAEQIAKTILPVTHGHPQAPFLVARDKLAMACARSAVDTLENPKNAEQNAVSLKDETDDIARRFVTDDDDDNPDLAESVRKLAAAAFLHGTSAAKWAMDGGTHESFLADEKLFLQAAREKAFLALPFPIGIAGKEAETCNGAREAMIAIAARSHALAAGPLQGSSPESLFWTAATIPPFERDASCTSETAAFHNALKSANNESSVEAAMIMRMRKSAYVVFADIKPGADTVKSASAAVKRAAMRTFLELDRAVCGHALEDIGTLAEISLGAPLDPKTQTAEIARRIRERFGFLSVSTDGIHGETSLRLELLRTEKALADSCERLGIEDRELGRNGLSCLTVSGHECRNKGFAGFCQTGSGDITLATPADVSTVVHEWAHSIDGIVGRRLFPNGDMLGSVYADTYPASDLPAAALAREMASAMRDLPTADQTRYDEEAKRIGRLACSQAAIEAIGRERWATSSESQRNAFLDEAWRFGLGIACVQAGCVKNLTKTNSSWPLKPDEEQTMATVIKNADLTRKGRLSDSVHGIAGTLSSHFGADFKTAFSKTLGLCGADGLGLGLAALRVGNPGFSRDGQPSITPAKLGANDSLCMALDLASFGKLSPGYWGSPHEMLARAVERHTSAGFVEHLERLPSAVFTATGKASGERFKKAWDSYLESAGVRTRPGGMRLSNPVARTLESCFAAVNKPLAKGIANAGALLVRARERRVAKALSLAASQTEQIPLETPAEASGNSGASFCKNKKQG